MEALTQVDLKRLLLYNSKTGVFTWREGQRNNVKAGAIAGYVGPQGYRRIRIGGKKYKSSRLAFLYMKGSFPEREVDHKNGIKNDDWWDNLRDVSHKRNSQNTKYERGLA